MLTSRIVLGSRPLRLKNQWHIILLVRTAKPQQCDLGEAKRVRQKGKQKEGASATLHSGGATAAIAREKLSTFGARMSLLDRILAEGLPADPITRPRRITM